MEGSLDPTWVAERNDDWCEKWAPDHSLVCWREPGHTSSHTNHWTNRYGVAMQVRWDDKGHLAYVILQPDSCERAEPMTVEEMWGTLV